MAISINAKTLRASLPEVVRRVKRGDRFTVIYRSRPAFTIVPVDEGDHAGPLSEKDSLYQARAVGRSSGGRPASEHDDELYGA
ncbi:MAG: type II toxin-antitoxin system prevent-host-death family antitoxin [Cyanobacteria bacterium]|nr:type II toxin-antitoxin system prevent-host-death family antitoxin [Cyanobacteriota bacterium]